VIVAVHVHGNATVGVIERLEGLVAMLIADATGPATITLLHVLGSLDCGA